MNGYLSAHRIVSNRSLRRIAIVAVLVPLASCSAAPSGESVALTSGSQQATTQFGDPLPGLTSAQQADFLAGRAHFTTVEDAADGLGPIFNDVSCASCHAQGAVGGGADRIETRFGTITAGQFDPLSTLGGSLIQENVIPDCAFARETVPPQATIRAGRRTTPLFGLGLVDAVPDATFVALAASERQNSAATAGTVSMVPNLFASQRGVQSVGKFGWKAQNPSLIQFSADAYLNEMGVTSPKFPDENCPQGNCALLACNPDPGINDDGTDVTAFANFMTLLAPPPPTPLAPNDKEGETRFGHIGCGDCHTATLTTGPSPIAALANVTFHPYSDFLLHDMGRLGDGIQQNAATGALMRTAPLWGLRAITSFLHDGRAKTVTDAILAHDGQGKAARDQFAALPAAQQAKVLAFLASL